VPAKLQCPHCGRSIPRPAQAGDVTCDGCEQKFDPDRRDEENLTPIEKFKPVRVRHEIPSLAARIIGVILLALGAISLLPIFLIIPRLDFRHGNGFGRAFGVLLLPASLIAGGIALAYVKRMPVQPSGELEDFRARHDSSATDAMRDVSYDKQIFTSE
jgi:hypothetical protein